MPADAHTQCSVRQRSMRWLLHSNSSAANTCARPYLPGWNAGKLAPQHIEGDRAVCSWPVLPTMPHLHQASTSLCLCGSVAGSVWSLMMQHAWMLCSRRAGGGCAVHACRVPGFAPHGTAGHALCWTQVCLPRTAWQHLAGPMLEEAVSRELGPCA